MYALQEICRLITDVMEIMSLMTEISIANPLNSYNDVICIDDVRIE